MGYIIVYLRIKSQLALRVTCCPDWTFLEPFPRRFEISRGIKCVIIYDLNFELNRWLLNIHDHLRFLKHFALNALCLTACPPAIAPGGLLKPDTNRIASGQLYHFPICNDLFLLHLKYGIFLVRYRSC